MCCTVFFTGSQDCSVKLWEVSTGRCMKTLTVGGPVKDIAWNPNPTISLIIVAVLVVDSHNFDLSLCMCFYL